MHPPAGPPARLQNTRRRSSPALNMSDEALAQFCAITGADQATAAQHLEAGGGSLEAAMELFFSGALEQGGGGGGGGGGFGGGGGGFGGGGGGFGGFGGGGPGPAAFEDDEALARRLQA